MEAIVELRNALLAHTQLEIGSICIVASRKSVSAGLFDK